MAEFSAGADRNTRRDLTQRLIRPFAARWLLVLAMLALLVVVEEVLVQPQLARLDDLAPAINVAGRQRMLSQKLSKEALALAACEAEPARRRRRAELRSTIDRWSAAHRALVEGGAEEILPPIRSAPALGALEALEPHFRAIRSAATQLASDASAGELARSPATAAPCLQTILDHEPEYLAGMERAVGLLERASQSQVAWLRGCGLVAAAFVLSLLIAIYFAVLRAAAQLVRRQARREMRSRAQARRRLARLSAELAHASRVTALGQLAAGLAHEINQPLATIVNYAEACELLFERALPGDSRARRAAAEMKHAASRAGAIVRRMRSFVRPGAAQAVEVDLNDLVREVAELCRAEFARSDVAVSLDLCGSPAKIYADALAIEQVLVNLFQNAIQALLAMPRDGRALRVHTWIEAGHAQFEAADSGPGFAAGQQDVFAPFFTTKPDGLGLGLSISRSIIERHRGRIWAETAPYGGALVRCRLPLSHPLATFDEQPADSLCG